MGMLVMQRQENGHVDDEAVERYSLGDSSEEESARLEEHLFVCAACRRRLTEHEAYNRAMQTAAARIRAREAPQSWWLPPRWAGALAAAALAVVIVLAGVRHWMSRPLAPPLSVHLTTMRGATAATAPAGHRMVLQPDLSALPPLPSYRLEMVDRMGKRVWEGAAGAVVPPMAPGVYFIRLHSPQGKLLREYGLEVKK